MDSSSGPQLQLVITERISADVLRHGWFRIPKALEIEALSYKGARVLLVEALPEARAKIVGTAILRGIVAMAPDHTGLQLDTLRLFRSPVPLPDPPAPNVVFTALPEGYIAEVVGHLHAAEDAPRFEPAPADHARAVLDACGWTCCLSGAPILPDVARISDFVSMIVPAPMGGEERPGNLIAVLPQFGRWMLEGAISFEDDGALLLAASRLPVEIIAALGPGYRLLQPSPPFDISASTLGLHRESLFAQAAIGSVPSR